MPEFPNGKLQPSRGDAVWKFLATHETGYTGDDQSIGWTVTIVKADHAALTEAIREINDPIVWEYNAVGGFTQGWYLVHQNSDGLVWAYFYGGWVRQYAPMPELLRQDFSNADGEFNRFCAALEEEA